MIAYALGARRADEAVRVVRALGSHRYVAGRLHLVHALALAAITEDEAGVLAEARAWADRTLADATLDAASRDERLWRRCGWRRAGFGRGRISRACGRWGIRRF